MDRSTSEHRSESDPTRSHFLKEIGLYPDESRASWPVKHEVRPMIDLAVAKTTYRHGTGTKTTEPIMNLNAWRVSLRTVILPTLLAWYVSGALQSRAGAGDLPAIPEPAPDPLRAEFGKNIPRTMALLARSTPERHWPVRILFYGQSITAQQWWQAVGKDVQARFPNAQIHIRPSCEPFSAQEIQERFPTMRSTIANQAIGGFGIPWLRRTAEHDVYPYYPDLIVLHAYSVAKDNSLDKFVAELRRRTTAEIMLWTHHVDTRKRMPGQDDAEYQKMLAEHQQRREVECAEIRRVAEKYGCEMAEVRIPWEEYLQDNHMEIEELLSDGIIHLNPKGWALMAKLISPHFQYVEGAVNPWSQCIQTQAVQPDEDGHIRVRFTGNRIDVVAATTPAGVKNAAAKVLIDGKAPSENSDLYAITRPSKAQQTWSPAIMRIGHQSPLLIEDWTLHVTQANKDATDIRFEVSGSKTGPDGAGDSKTRFVSNSGRVVIEPSDWKVADVVKYQKKLMPEDFKVTWSVAPQFVDVCQPLESSDPGRVRITTLAQGLETGPHTLELIPEGSAKLAIEAVRIHCPPGASNAAK